MTHIYKLSTKLALTVAMLFFVVSDASAFDRNSSVTTTAFDTDTSDGDPIRATWGVVPDGTTVPSTFVGRGVRLVSDFRWRLDETYNVAEVDRIDDITQRPWFAVFEDAMETFSIRSGITYTYEPNDDGVPVDTGGNGGIEGVRPDVRISGIEFSSGSVLAHTTSGGGFHGEIVFNTIETREWNINTLRGITIHENMHALGFGHSIANRQGGTTALGFNVNGPQYDDLLGLHYNYGDRFEKSGGNDTLGTATDLGAVNAGEALELGLDVTAGDDYTTVGITASDFVSVDSNTDTDFYKFSVESGGDVAVAVMPRGPSYTWTTTAGSSFERPPVAGKLHSDLSFKIFDVSGTQLFEVADAAIGTEESITTALDAGDYYVEISGVSTLDASVTGEIPTQFYSLAIATAPTVSDQSLAVAQIGTESINLGSDSALTYTVLSNPPNGTLSGTAPNLIYTPNTGFEGIDSFTFSASRDGLESAVATITLEVADFITLSRVSNGNSNSNGYDIPQAEAVAFRSTGVPKTFDADGDNAYGTAGLAIFSVLSGEGNSGFDDYIGEVAPWVSSITPGSDFVTSVQFPVFTDFDNPTLEISTDVEDLTVTGYARSNNGAVGTWAELVNFTIDETAPTAIRIGVLAGNNAGALIDPSGIRLSVNGSEPVEATSLNLSVGMVFFDLLLRSPITANFSLEAQINGEDRQTAIAGITFDVISSGFDAWVLDFQELDDNSVDSDPDNDGIEALLEYVLNGSPTGNDQAILPQVTIENGNFIFDFNRLASSAIDTVQVFQYSTTLEPNDWVDVPITSANTGQVSLSPVAGDSEMEAVSITVDAALGNQNRLFGRLKVSLEE